MTHTDLRKQGVPKHTTYIEYIFFIKITIVYIYGDGYNISIERKTVHYKVVLAS